MRPEDVYALTSVGDARVSPDGSRVAYVVNWIDREANGYRAAIWVRPLESSEEEPRRLTSGTRSDSSPRWSPDGRWLAFVSNRDGEDENAHGELYVLPANGGEPRRLTDGIMMPLSRRPRLWDGSAEAARSLSRGALPSPL